MESHRNPVGSEAKTSFLVVRKECKAKRCSSFKINFGSKLSRTLSTDGKRASLLRRPCWIRTNELQASVCRIVRVIVFPSLLVLWLDIKSSQILARETGHSHRLADRNFERTRQHGYTQANLVVLWYSVGTIHSAGCPPFPQSLWQVDGNLYLPLEQLEHWFVTVDVANVPATAKQLPCS